jgi:hypothetical protein
MLCFKFKVVYNAAQDETFHDDYFKAAYLPR